MDNSRLRMWVEICSLCTENTIDTLILGPVCFYLVFNGRAHAPYVYSAQSLLFKMVDDSQGSSLILFGGCAGEQ
jgi:hypothetical protein